MNEAARKTWEMMQAGTGNPLAPENIETTRAAFPIALDDIRHVSSGVAGLAAVGFAGSCFPLVAWVNVDGTSGYQQYQPDYSYTCELKSKRPNAIVRLWREACWRVSGAWDALCGRES